MEISQKFVAFSEYMNFNNYNQNNLFKTNLNAIEVWQLVERAMFGGHLSLPDTVNAKNATKEEQNCYDHTNYYARRVFLYFHCTLV